MSQHAPGPWKAAHYGVDCFRREVVHDSNIGLVCTIAKRGDEGKRIARIIAAAPDLLDALQHLLRLATATETETEAGTRHSCGNADLIVSMARKAIAKAGGAL